MNLDLDNNVGLLGHFERYIKIFQKMSFFISQLDNRLFN